MTMLVYDPRCLLHTIPMEETETPQRVLAIQQKLSSLGLQTLPPREATTEDLLRCHTPAYLELVDKDIADVTRRGVRDDEMMTLSTGDTFVCPASKEAALAAAGGVLNAVDAVVNRQAHSVFCNVRPPGHHAKKGAGNGFCIFNNVAIGARYAQAVHKINKIMIIDWDVHHGDGTEDIFQGDPSVSFFSTYQEGIFASPQTGTENHIPIAKDDQARLTIRRLFKETLPTKIATFQPDLIFLSAGFDARMGDPLGNLNLTDEDFAEMTKDVKTAAGNCPIISVLEGGYNCDGIASASLAHVKALMA
ncbi:MAG: histone deacetylase [Chlamydiia bacterium]|nr:histone deacetylase [Chlamydiia bacterium]